MVKQNKIESKVSKLEQIALTMTEWVGTTQSLIIHSFLFLGALALIFLGFNSDQVLLILTTLVSLEAIYLGIFIQMTVNRNTKSLEEVEEDIDEIQEDVEDLEEDVEELSEDVEDIQEEDKKDNIEEKQRSVMLKNIEQDMDKLLSDIQTLKKNMPTSVTKKYLNG